MLEVKEKMENKNSTDGCPHCGMAYSFFFGVQYHLKTCPLVLANPTEFSSELQ